jgi:hypothetical protein
MLNDEPGMVRLSGTSTQIEPNRANKPAITGTRRPKP